MNLMIMGMHIYKYAQVPYRQHPPAHIDKDVFINHLSILINLMPRCQYPISRMNRSLHNLAFIRALSLLVVFRIRFSTLSHCSDDIYIRPLNSPDANRKLPPSSAMVCNIWVGVISLL